MSGRSGYNPNQSKIIQYITIITIFVLLYMFAYIAYFIFEAVFAAFGILWAYPFFVISVIIFAIYKIGAKIKEASE